jgi:hypothetical protein
MNETDRLLHDGMARQLAARGEPFLSYFAPAALAADLRGVGFTRVEDLGPDEIHDRYFKGRTDGLRVNGMARLVKATNRRGSLQADLGTVRLTRYIAE